MKALEDAFKGKVEHKIDRRGLFFLISCWITAIKLFRKDKKRFNKLF